MTTIQDIIYAYGGHLANLKELSGKDNPYVLDYTTLLTGRNSETSDAEALVAVYEWQDKPLLLLIDGEQLVNDELRLQRIRRRAALHGAIPYLGVASSGRLYVYHVALDNAQVQATQLKLDVEQILTLPYLAATRPKSITSRQQWISGLILSLLNETQDALISAGLSDEDAISLSGRALFTRFLADRELIPPNIIKSRDVSKLFDTRLSIRATNDWLDETFNGDLLPLSKNVWNQTNQSVCHALGNILHRAQGGQLYLGWNERWDYLDFAHIPVGVLSQAYEGYLRKRQPHKQRKQSAYYTPLHIAETLVHGAFHALRREGKAAKATILDPAAGAGIFLITVFRQLVTERWRESGQRPNTKDLRNILYNQITGFDIDEAALRFAALGLYLVSIELDPNPHPVNKLRFNRDLRGRVLWKYSGRDGLGSLGSQVGNEHIGRYDLVIGNPPWSSSRLTDQWPAVTRIVENIAQERLGENAPSSLVPDGVPDLPFLWRSIKWAKHNAQLAFALHARLLFQRGDGMPDARAAVFSALSVSGIVNGSELRGTRVWPQVSVPFCLLFAKNCLPEMDSAFRYLSPRIEQTLNHDGIMRFDSSNSEIISNRQVATHSTIFKTLFRGTRLDFDLVEKIHGQDTQTLINYWKSLFGTYRGKPKQAGIGYQKLGTSSRTRKSGLDSLPGVSASYLRDILELNHEAAESLVIDSAHLDKFTDQRIHDPRPISIFKGPLLIVKDSPKSGIVRIGASISESEVVYNKSYYGYSATGHSDALLLIKYLALIIRSKFALWYVLVTSGKFGVERETIEKSTIDAIPIIPLDRLHKKDIERVTNLFEAVSNDMSDINWLKVDEWVASLYGLTDRDLQTINDTLKYQLPYSANKNEAQSYPPINLINDFSNTLSDELKPWLQDTNINIHADIPKDLPHESPWQWLRLSVNQGSSQHITQSDQDNWRGLTRIADHLGVTELIHADNNHSVLWIARLKQARYWTRTQARLLANRIALEHIDLLM